MLTIRDHDVEDYVALRDMDATDVGTLSEDDRACLDELGDYLVSTDTFRRFGIWLLHKHFEPDAGEVFAESVITAPRGTQTTPVKRCFAQGLNATSMRFDPDVSSGVGVIGMEFADPAEFGSTSSVSPDDEAALTGIARRLGAHDKSSDSACGWSAIRLASRKTKPSSKPATSHTGPCIAPSASVTASAPAPLSKQLGSGHQA